MRKGNELMNQSQGEVERCEAKHHQHQRCDEAETVEKAGEDEQWLDLDFQVGESQPLGLSSCLYLCTDRA
jgi:hypothetical protein